MEWQHGRCSGRCCESLTDERTLRFGALFAAMSPSGLYAREEESQNMLLLIRAPCVLLAVLHQNSMQVMLGFDTNNIVCTC